MAARLMRSYKNFHRFVRLSKAALDRCDTLAPSSWCVLKLRNHATYSSQEHALMLKKRFGWIQDHAPVFGISGDTITILRHPSEYYNTLQMLARNCRKRMVIASLYLGTGKLETDLVHAITEALQDSPDLEVTILLDCTRGSRGEHNSRTMLTPLLQQYPERVNVSLYHSPDLRGLLKRLIPERFNEVIGLSHLKVYIFDDTFITSGANLSNDYFENRQDRYIRIDACPQLVSFHESLVKTVCKFSFRLCGDNSLTVEEDFGIHPFNDDKEEFRVKAKGLVQSVICPTSWRNRTRSHIGMIGVPLGGDPDPSNNSEPLEHEHQMSSPTSISQSISEDLLERGEIGHSSSSPNHGDFDRAGLSNIGASDTLTTDDKFAETNFSGGDVKVELANGEVLHRNGFLETDTVDQLDQRSNMVSNSESPQTLTNGSTERITDRQLHTSDRDRNRSIGQSERTKVDADRSSLNSKRSDVDTWICPLVQMGPLGITVDQSVTAELLDSMKEGDRLHLASGYFNLTQQYKQLLLRSKAKCEILTASPQVNGFYGASGISGYIPDSYTYIAKKFHRSVCRRRLQDQIRLHEYYHNGWTFHAKGLWYYLRGYSQPSLTMIGSPNFGHRSVSRDLESQLVVVTTNQNLQEQLHQEQVDLYSRAETVDEATFEKPDRKVPLWVKVVTLVGHNFY